MQEVVRKYNYVIGRMCVPYRETGNNNLAYLAAFNSGVPSGIIPVTWGKINRTKQNVTFSSVIPDRYYFPVYYSPFGKSFSFGEPFYLDKGGKIIKSHIEGKADDVTLLRKFPMKQGLEDWEFWLNFIEDNKSFYKIDEALFFYRIVNASRNQSVSKSKGKELVKIIRKKHKKLFGWKFKIKLLFFKLMRFFYRKKVTKSGQVCIKICAIPLSVKFLQLLNGEKNNG